MHYCYSLIQKVIELIGRNIRGIPILMFHQVSDNNSEWKDKNVSIKQSSFEALIESLIKKGYSFISIDQLEESLGQRAIVITFDDVFRDAIENAVPYLNSHHIPYCLFISDCYIDKTGYISSDQIAELANNPLCTIGYHSKSHCMFRKTSDDDVALELDSSVLQEKINSTINFFAYPYGSVYACGFGKAKQTKGRYLYCFSTIAVKCSRFWIKHFPYYLPRINICEDNWKRVCMGLK